MILNQKETPIMQKHAKQRKPDVKSRVGSAKMASRKSHARDRRREEDIRLSFHNGMLAGLEEVRREVKDEKASEAIAKIQNRVLAHRDSRDHRSSRWYKGSCRTAVVCAEKCR